MAIPVIDWGAFTGAEQTAMLTAAKLELSARLTGGTVRSGGSAAQQYTMDKLSDEALFAMINGLTDALGLSATETRVRPNFNSNSGPLLNGFGF